MPQARCSFFFDKIIYQPDIELLNKLIYSLHKLIFLFLKKKFYLYIDIKYVNLQYCKDIGRV